MTSRAKWLKERQQGIGGSDVAALIGADPRRGPLDLYLEKTGEIADDEDSADLEAGRMLEPIIRRKYRQQTGRKVRTVKTALVDPEAPFIRANVDGLIEQQGRRGVFEAKSMRVAVFMAAVREGLPERFVAQIQWYLQKALAAADFGAFAVFSRELWKLVDFDIEPDVELQRLAREAATTFWNDHVLARRPPAPDGWAVKVLPVQAKSDLQELDTPALRAAVSTYAEARDLVKTGEELKKAAREQVLDAIGGKPGAYQCAEGVAHLIELPGRTSFDKKALAAARPIDREKLLEALGRRDQSQAYVSIVQTMLLEEGAGVDLDLGQFEKQGKSYQTVQVYVRGDTDKENAA